MAGNTPAPTGKAVTPKTGGTGNPVIPPVTKPVGADKATLLDGTGVRHGKVTTEYTADVVEGDTIQTPDVEVPAAAAALFDEEGLDPYERANAQ